MRRRVERLILARVVDRDRQVQEVGDPTFCGESLYSFDGGRRHKGDPQSAIRTKALLRGEVVDVRLTNVDGEAPGRAGGVHGDERTIGVGRALNAKRPSAISSTL